MVSRVQNSSEAPDRVERKHNKSRFTLPQRLAAAAIGGGLAMGALAGCSSDASAETLGNGTPTAASTTNSQEVATSDTPKETPTPTDAQTPQETDGGQETDNSQESFLELVDSFNIDATKFTSPEAIADAYADCLENWQNAGLTVAFDENYLVGDAPATINSITQHFSTDGEPDSLIKSKLFTNGPGGIAAQDRLQKTRDGVITDFWVSQSRGDAVPYRISEEIVSASLVQGSLEQGSFVVKADLHGTDNGDLNIGPNRIANGEPAQLDTMKHVLLAFELDTTTNTWKISGTDQYADTENNSK